MDVKEAVRAAKAYVRDVYSDESIGNIGLEETAFDSSLEQWHITVGFQRRFNEQSPLLRKAIFSDLNKFIRDSRWYKVVIVDVKSEKVVGMRDRLLRDAA